MSKMENATSVQSMTERYSFGHKVVSVVLSAVLVGFGWPAVSPSEVFAEDGAAASAAVEQSASGTAAISATEQSAATAGQAVVVDQAAGQAASGSAASAGSAGSASDGASSAASGSASQSQGGAAADQVADEADVELTLGHASITYRDQVIAQPADKVTVPSTEKFEFTVAADNGYALTQVKLKVAGSDENAIEPDEHGVYAVAAADVAKGAAVTLVTEKKQQVTSTPQDATPIEDAAGVSGDASADENANPVATYAATSSNYAGVYYMQPGETINLPWPSANGGWVSYNAENGNTKGLVTINDASGSVYAWENEGEVVVECRYSSGAYGWNNVQVDRYLIVIGSAKVLSITGPDTVKTGKTISLTTSGATGTVKWTSSDPSIAEVDENGVVTGKRPGKVTIIATSGSQSASKDITVTRDETGGYYVYMYTKVYGSTQGLTLKTNKDGWYTIGKLWVPGIRSAQSQGGSHRTSGADWDATMKALQDPSNIELYGVNSINLSDILWNVSGMKDQTNSTGLSTASGAADYVAGGTQWHLDGYVYVLGMGSVKFNHLDKDTGKQIHATTSVTAKEDAVLDSVDYKQSVTGYLYDHADLESVTVQKGTTLEVNLYYSKGSYPYTVKYVDKDTGKDLKNPQTKGGEFGSTVTEKAATITGYTPDVDTKDLTISADGENTITFYYTKKTVSYTINYLWNGTDEKVAESRTVNDRLFGSEITASPLSVANCTPVSNDAVTMTLGETDNVINFYYYKNVSLQANSKTVTYTGKPQSVSGYTGAPEGAQFSFNVSAEGTDAGTYDAKFPSDAVGTVDGSNRYMVTSAKDGKLVINRVSSQVTVTITGNTQTETYNGKEQKATGYSVSIDDESGLYKQDYITFGGTAEAKGTNAGTYPMGLKATSFTNGSSNFDNVVFKVTDGSLTISKRNVTLTSASADKVYDGTRLTNNTVTIGGDGFAEGEGATFNVTGAITNAGTTPNAFTYALKSGTDKDNYTITKAEGTLEVKPVAEEVVVEIKGATNSDTYDGVEKSAEGYSVAKVSNKLYASENVALKQGVAAKATGTNAGTYPMGLTSESFENKSLNFTNVKFVVEDGSLVINKRNVTLTSASAEKVYDGSALTKDEVTASENGFVGNDGFTAKCTGSQTLVGGSPNAFTYELNEGTNGDNYTITKSEGTLTVKNRDAKYEITVVAQSGSATYDGKDHTVSGFEQTEFEIDGDKYTVSGLTASVTGKDAGEYANNVTGTPVVKDAAGNDVSGQFAVSTEAGKLAIGKRGVTLTSGSAKREYNGEALTNGDVAVSGDGFAEGEGADFDVAGTITNAGTAPNAFTYELKSGTKAENYTITPVEGTLEVTPVAAKVTVTVTENSGSAKYDGSEKKVTGYTWEADNALYGESDFSFSGSAIAKGTDAGTYDMQLSASDFANISNNFKEVTFVIVDGALTIGKRSVTLTSGSSTREYNGEALTNGDVAVSGDGFAEGEGADFDVTGTITNAGTAPNAFTYELKSGTKAENYTITPVEGTLEVTPVAAKVTVTITGHKGGQKYTGSKQTVSGYDVSISNALYTASGFDFTGKAEVEGTNAGTYNMGLSKADFANTSKNFKDVEFVVSDGQLAIGKRDVVLTSASAEKVYDGTALTNSDVAVSGDDFAEGEGASFDVTGSQTVAGSSENTFTYELNESTSEDNYNISQNAGTLTVKNRDAKYEVTIKANSATATYDGKAHEAKGVETYQFTVNNQTFTVEGLSTTDPVQVDAGEYANNVTGTPVVKDAAGNDVSGQFAVSTEAGKLAIGKRGVTLTSGSAKREYNGKPLTNGDVAVSGDDFAEGEGADFDVTGTITNAGTAPNAFTYELKSGTKAENYTITPVEGTLEVTPVASEVVVTIAGKSATKAYTGSEQSVTGYEITGISNSLLSDSDIEFSGSAEARGTAAGEYPMGLSESQFSVRADNKNFSKVSFVVADGSLTITPQSIDPDDPNPSYQGINVGVPASHVYDGKEHKWAPTVTDSQNNKLTEGVDYEVAYTRDGETVDDFTNVTGVITATVTGKGNYAGKVTRTYQITKRSVVLASDSHSKTYDGTPLSCENLGWCEGVVSVGAYDFVQGEVSDVKATGSITEVGSTSNTISFTKNSSYRDSNYDLREYPGTLTVTPKAVTAVGMTVGELDNVVYNGLSQQQKPEVKDGSAVLAEGKDYTLTFSQDTTNVGKVTVTVTGKGNYSGSVERTYLITPATLTVTTPDASKTYDGKPLTAAGSISGFVNNESAPFTTTGTQTEVGSSSNAYAIDWNAAGATAKANNYTVSATVGTLTVSAQAITPGDDPSNPDASYKGVKVSEPSDVPYDGASHVWEPEVADVDGSVLVKGRDYEVSYAPEQDFTNVTGDIVVTIKGIGNYSGTITKSYQITALKVSVETKGATKVYDGTALTNDEGSITGLIEGESGLVSVVPNGTRTEVGSADNTYTINWNGVKSSNYVLDSETLGTLVVTAQSIVPGTEDKPNPSYNGVQVDSPTDHVYDGAKHQWTPTVTDKDGKALTAGANYEVTYTRGNAVIDDFTNVTGVITVTITGKGNYTGSVTRTYQITPAELTVTTPGAEKVYDGKPLTKEASAEDCIKGLVNGEKVSFKTTGSRTDVGESDNTYAIDWNATGTTAKAGNYQIVETKLGKLVVKESADQITVTTTGGEFTYDGKAHGATVSVSELPAGYTLESAESSATATDVNGNGLAATADKLIIRNAQNEDVTAKLNIKRVDGSIKVTPAKLTVTTPSASKVFDGSALTAAGKLEGLVNGETATFATTGEQTAVGTSTNAYKITWDGTAKASNYAISEDLGTLSVTEQSITPGTDSENPDPAYKGIQVGQLDNTMYNGNEQKFEPRVSDASGVALVKDRDYTLSWSADVVNAGTVKVIVTGKGNYAGTVERTYAIGKRPVSLKSESASKTYDGTALERPSVVVTSEYDFVAGEVANMTATGSITNAGSEVNAIELSTTAAFKASNYDITRDEGTLTVSKASAAKGIELKTQSASKLYDGSALTLPEASASTTQGANDVVIEYQKADGSWTENAANITATNVTDSREVAVRASSKRNFDGFAYGTATLTVNVRNVTLTSESASKAYDGATLERLVVAVSGDGFAANEVSNVRATGSIANVGSVLNAITFDKGERFAAGNYNIAYEPGTLTVTEQSIVPGTEEKPNPAYNGVSVSSPTDYVYDGAEHKWAPNVTDKDGKALIENVDYTVAYSTSDFTNVAGAITVTITGKGNYAGSVSRTYQITPASLSVETFSASKTYDGEALTAGGKVEGFVAGETYGFATTGSQTAVGSSKNTYAIEWNGTAKASNYQVTEQKIGMLTVNEFAGKVTVTTTGGEFTYDGQAHGAAVSVTGLPTGYYVEQAYSNASARTVADGEVAATADGLVIKNAQGQDVTGNLDIAYVNGTIKVNPAPLTVTTGSAKKHYDGVAATNEEASVEGAQGMDRIFVWATGEQTEVGESANSYGISWGTADARNYQVTEKLGSLVVDPNDAAVEIKGANATKTYDGATLATNDVASVSGLPEGFTVELTAEGSQTNAGTSENAVKSYAIKNRYGEDATAFFANVTVVPGTLTVEPAELRVSTGSASKVYDGSALTSAEGSIEGLVAGETAELEVTGSQTEVGSSDNTYVIGWGTAKAGNYRVVSEDLGTLTVTAQAIDPGSNPSDPDPAYKGITVSSPADFVYDGAAHRWSPEVKDGNKVLVEGVDYTVAYSTSDFTNVTGDITVTVTGKGNYAGSATRTYQITPRDVVLASESDSKAYDGTALERPDVTVLSNYDFVAGEVSDLVATGSALNAGDSAANAIAYTKNAAYRDANYNVEKREGTLSVYAKQLTAADMTVGTVDDVTYNGLEQRQKPEVTDGSTVLREGIDYDLVYSADVVNAGGVTVKVVGKGNYAGEVERSYTIKKAPLSVVTESASKPYDGEALTAGGMVSGFVNGEDAEFATTGTQTVAGSSTNWYIITWNGTAKASNYRIAEQLGTLTVTESENEVVVTTTGGTFPYDGMSHGATVEVTGLPAGYTAQASSSAAATDVNGDGIAATADNLVIRNTNGEDVTAGLNIKRVDGSIKVMPVELSVVTPSASKVYDGEALTAAGTITGFVAGETATLKTTGSQTAAGSSENTYEIAWDGTAKAGNYTVVESIGTLTVTEQSVTPGSNPSDPDPAYRGIAVSSPADIVYDGQEHKWEPTVTDKDGKTLVAGVDYDVTYSVDNFMDVTGTITVIVMGKGNYVGAVVRSYQITPASVKVSTDSAERAYNGAALQAPGRIEGLVNGETVTFAVTGSQTEAGSSVNGYELAWDGTAKASNYSLSEDLGTLLVSKADVADYVTLATADASKTYDGVPLAAAEAVASDALGNDVRVQYSVDGVNWVDNAADIKAVNVADSCTVQVRASSERNYAGFVTGTQKLTVNKRSVVLESESATKTYDGAALEYPAVTVSGDDFVAGEASNVRATGSITDVGSVSNAIAFDKGAGFDENNYRIEERPGTLSVTAKSLVDGAGMSVSAPIDVEYDGLEHQWQPTVLDGEKALVNGQDYTVAYSTDDFTNAAGVITVTIAGKGNYAGAVVRSYRITPAPLSVETFSASKTYDGEALTAGGELSGLKNGETATFAATGSQTAVGSSENGYALAFDQTAKGSNYQLASEQLGTLTVTESADQIVVTTTGGTFTYDGQAHGASVSVGELPAGYVLDTAVSSASATDVADGIVAATADKLVIRNAQGQDVTGNLNISYVDGQIEVTPATLNVTTAGASKEFDNTPLVNDSMSIAGLVPGDSVTAKTTGSQTQVGSSENTYEITWTGADERNYAIAEQLGTLTVTPQPVVPQGPDTPAPTPGGTPTTPGGTPSTPGTTVVPPTTPTPTPQNPVDAIAQVLEGAVDAVTGQSDQVAEEQIFDDENPLGTTAHANCWVHYLMLIGMILTVLYGAGVAGRRGRFSHGLTASMNDVLGASSKND